MIKKKLALFPEVEKSKINKEIYGHFSEHLGRCIYQGIFVGEDSKIPNVKGMRTDVVEALKELDIPVLRWPGGCFADEYHWKNGVGPKENRATMINTHWGGVTEDNSFGTHEFMELCEQRGCEPYISGNVGSGTVQELSEWIEYMTSDNISPMTDWRKQNGREAAWKLRFLGVGNENWGCGGNMTPEYYANLYRHYQTYCRNYGDNRLYKIACGPSGDDYSWTEKIMQIIKPCHADAISLHYYTVPFSWEKRGQATVFDENAYYTTIACTRYIESIITRHLEIMNKYDPEHKIGLVVDEWGCWWDVETGTNPGFLYQQNTMRDAVVAAINLNIFNEHSARVVMANIAQVVNVLQAVILTDGAKILKTPTYHVFHMFKDHQEATSIAHVLEDTTAAHGEVSIPDVSVSASKKDGELTVTLCNANLSESYALDVHISGEYAIKSAKILTGAMGDYNSFENPTAVEPKDFNDFENTASGASVTLPPCSIVTLKL